MQNSRCNGSSCIHTTNTWSVQLQDYSPTSEDQDGKQSYNKIFSIIIGYFSAIIGKDSSPTKHRHFLTTQENLSRENVLYFFVVKFSLKLVIIGQPLIYIWKCLYVLYENCFVQTSLFLTKLRTCTRKNKCVTTYPS